MALARMAAGIVADQASEFGLQALMSNANAYCGHLENVASAGTNTTLTANQCRRRVIRLTTGASGDFTLTLPSTKSIIAALGPTILTDNTYGQVFQVFNDGTTHTATLTAGDASTTITGTATVATDTTRTFMVMVTGASTLTYFNIGSMAA